VSRVNSGAVAEQKETPINRFIKSLAKTEAVPERKETTMDGLNEYPAGTESKLAKLAGWIDDRNIPFLVTSIGMIVMLLWAGSFKMTAPGAEGIIPLVTNSPLIWWDYKIFGPYIGADFIGLTEWIAAALLIAGYFKPKAGMLGGIILLGMFFTTSTMLITTPDAIISYHGMRYMNNLGLFLFKDFIAFGASFYLISSFGKKAFRSEKS
jgi:uncharacterized membrane protein YkgB